MISLLSRQQKSDAESGCQSSARRPFIDNAECPKLTTENVDSDNSASRMLFCDTHSYSKPPRSTQALNTFVEMALALQENTERSNDHNYAIKQAKDHTYALKNSKTEEAEHPYKRKDHTYASNTIGFRYTSHRGAHAQPRKSVSEENLVAKSNVSSGTSARKCTSTEEFAISNEPHISSCAKVEASQSSLKQGSNAATLPRSKARSYDQGIFHEHVDTGTKSDFVQSQVSSASDVQVVKQGLKDANCDNDSDMEAPMKCDHTYAKYRASGNLISLLSTSAPEKLNPSEFDAVYRSSYADHTYDKLSSAKVKSYEAHMICPSFGNSGIVDSTQSVNLNKNTGNINTENTSSCSSAMDWQPQENVQNFERRFLPIDHTYTTVA